MVGGQSYPFAAPDPLLLVEQILTGQLPYAELCMEVQVMARIFQRKLLPVPDGLSPSLLAAMQACWQWDPQLRPTASKILQAILMSKVAEFSDLGVASLGSHQFSPDGLDPFARTKYTPQPIHASLRDTTLHYSENLPSTIAMNINGGPHQPPTLAQEPLNTVVSIAPTTLNQATITNGSGLPPVGSTNVFIPKLKMEAEVETRWRQRIQDLARIRSMHAYLRNAHHAPLDSLPTISVSEEDEEYEENEEDYGQQSDAENDVILIDGRIHPYVFLFDVSRYIHHADVGEQHTRK
jgi:hypothetical protein